MTLLVGWLVYTAVGPSVYLSVGWSIPQLVLQSVGRLVYPAVGPSVYLSVSRSIPQLVLWSICQLVGRSKYRSCSFDLTIGQLVYSAVGHFGYLLLGQSIPQLGSVYSGMENHDLNAVFKSMFW